MISWFFLLQAGVLVSNAPAHHFQAATAPADHFLGEPSKLIIVKKILPTYSTYLPYLSAVDATLWADNSVSQTKS